MERKFFGRREDYKDGWEKKEAEMKKAGMGGGEGSAEVVYQGKLRKWRKVGRRRHVTKGKIVTVSLERLCWYRVSEEKGSERGGKRRETDPGG